MIKLYEGGVYLVNGKEIIPEAMSCRRQKGHDRIFYFKIP